MANKSARKIIGETMLERGFVRSLNRAGLAADYILEALHREGKVIVDIEDIQNLGDACDICTHALTGRVCNGCRCSRAALAASPGGSDAS